MHCQLKIPHHMCMYIRTGQASVQWEEACNTSLANKNNTMMAQLHMSSIYGIFKPGPTDSTVVCVNDSYQWSLNWSSTVNTGSCNVAAVWASGASLIVKVASSECASFFVERLPENMIKRIQQRQSSFLEKNPLCLGGSTSLVWEDILWESSCCSYCTSGLNIQPRIWK